MRKRAFVVVGLLAGSLSSASANPSPAPTADSTPGLETVTIHVKLLPEDYGILPTLIADRQGYFKDAGIQIRYTSTQDYAGEPLLLRGRSDLYRSEAATPGRMKVVVFSVQDETASSDAYVVRTDSRAKTLRDVKDIRFVPFIYGGVAVGPITRQILLEHGFPEDRVKKTVVRGVKLGLSGGHEPLSLDWEVAYMREPVLSYYKSKGLVREILPGPVFAGHAFAPWIMSVTAFSGDFVQKQPELAAHVAAALNRAVAYIRDNPDRARDLYTTYCRESLKTPVTITNGLHHIASGDMPVTIVKRQIDWYFENSLIPRKPDADLLFYRAGTQAASIP